MWSERSRRNVTESSSGPYPTVEMLEEGRKQQLAKRESLIKAWREMVVAVHHQQRESQMHSTEPPTITALLERHPDFLSFRPYMSDRTRDGVWGRMSIVPPKQSTMSGSLHSILSDIDDMAKRWGIE